MLYYVIDIIVPALVCRAPYSSDVSTVIFSFHSVYLILFWFMVRASDRLVVFDGRAKLLSLIFEDKSLLTKEKIC